ncbi:hypothetical protein M5D96_006193 [Drosophila gunungcola]|uniref:Secreted protein n=1 Tax=Drosophila gunungcola TaxID=103775 RepID=A0A9P9YP75_9MUSC|nr:hypothetical protein M5D96_006193 [Drosophila gunungcola]
MPNFSLFLLRYPFIHLPALFIVSCRIYPYACRELKGFPVVIRFLAKKIVECFFNLRFTLCDTLITAIRLGVTCAPRSRKGRRLLFFVTDNWMLADGKCFGSSKLRTAPNY